ncbi:hypothetical protein CTEN210_08651 [Chaetoceros tenuissimus]|uniref:Uncharacterized protein n=1 Tax=Chaetoceros tenuissimus TaxID=426638 RepID=A0AAD3H6G7_9STRA|nr:hypothetical protein CTEN210_08651 [Chaetoceros tenuissimus]
MSAPVKKAAEAVAKKTIPAASRAVSAAEAPSIAPSATSSMESQMPWEGWFSSFLSSKLGKDKFDKLRSLVVFKTDHVLSGEQMPRPSTEVPISKDGSIKAQFRYPSPGSQEGGRQPTEDEGTLYEDPYFVSYYPRDTSRRYDDPAFPNKELEEMKLALLPQDDAKVQEAQAAFEEGAKSSPGNKGMFATGKSDFDPTGLRATMSTNHAAVEASLDANMPDHLPMPNWWNKQEELVQWYKDNDLPVPLGNTGFGTVPREGRIARW